jgi:threonine/homoserine/homoserine lactone efflux protein
VVFGSGSLYYIKYHRDIEVKRTLITHLFFGITLGFAAAVQPGPTQTFLISRTLVNGWRHSLPLASVYLVSDVPIVAVVLLILNNIPELFIEILHIVGGIFLLYLAWGALKAFRKYNENESVSQQSGIQNFFKAVTINLLNPNPYLTWSLVMGPLILEAFNENPAEGVSIAGGFYGSLILTTAGIIILFGMIKRLGAGISRILLGISAVALTGFGIYQINIGVLELTA